MFEAVEMDFAKASVPASDLAKSLFAEAVLPTPETKDGLKGIGSRQPMFSISPYALTIRDGWNSRDAKNPANVAHIDWLAKSIAENGVQEPLTVVWEAGKVIVTDGHCRLLAVFRAIEIYGAEIKAIRVKTEARGASEADQLATQILRNSGKPLEPIEQASVISRLEKFGWTVDDMSKRFSLTAARIRQLLELATAPAEVKSMVTRGEVSASLAGKILSSSETPAAAVEQLQEAVTVAKAEAREAGKDESTAKARPRHVEATAATRKPNFKAQLKEIFEKAEADNRADESEYGGHVVTFTADEWTAIRNLLDL